MCWKSNVLVVALTALPLGAHALTVSVFLPNPSPTVVRPGVGQTTVYTYTGTISVVGFSDGYEASVELPWLNGVNSIALGAQVNPGLGAAISSNLNGTNGGTYTGALFDVTVNEFSVEGTYGHVFGDNIAPLFKLTLSDSVNHLRGSASASYEMNVTAVPEPTTLVLLAGPAAIAVLRRRRRA